MNFLMLLMIAIFSSLLPLVSAQVTTTTQCPSGFQSSQLSTLPGPFDDTYAPDRNDYRTMSFSSTSALDGLQLLRDLYCHVQPTIQVGRLGLESTSTSNSSSSFVLTVVVLGQTSNTYAGAPASDIVTAVGKLYSAGSLELTQQSVINGLVVDRDPTGTKPPVDTSFVSQGLMAFLIISIVLFNISFITYRLRSRHDHSTTTTSSSASVKSSASKGLLLHTSVTQSMMRSNVTPNWSVHQNNTFTQSIHETQVTDSNESSQPRTNGTRSILIWILGLVIALFLTLAPFMLKSLHVSLASAQTSSSSCAQLLYTDSAAQLLKCAIETTKATEWFLSTMQISWLVGLISCVAVMLTYVQCLLYRSYNGLAWLPMWTCVAVSSIIHTVSSTWLPWQTRQSIDAFEATLDFGTLMLQSSVGLVACIASLFVPQWQLADETIFNRFSLGLAGIVLSVSAFSVAVLLGVAQVAVDAVDAPASLLYLVPLVFYVVCIALAALQERRNEHVRYERSLFWLPFAIQALLSLLSTTDAGSIYRGTLLTLATLLIYVLQVGARSVVNFRDTKELQRHLDNLTQNLMSPQALVSLNSNIRRILPSSLRDAIEVHAQQQFQTLLPPTLPAMTGEAYYHKSSGILKKTLKFVLRLMTSIYFWLLVLSIITMSVAFNEWSPSPIAYCTLHGQNDTTQCLQIMVSGLRGTYDHALLELTSSLLCLAVFFLALMHYATYRYDLVIFYAFAFLGSFMGDTIHNLVASRYITGSDVANFITYSWSVARLYNSSVLVLGSINVLVIEWMLKRRGASLSSAIHGRYLVAWAVLLILPLLIVMFYCGTAEALPKATFPNQVIVRPFDFPPFLLYICFFFVSVVIVFRSGNDHLSGMRHGLLFSALPNMVAQAHMSFGSLASFDADFNAAHFLKLIAYAFVALGLATDVFGAMRKKMRLQSQLMKIMDRTSSRVFSS